VPADGDHLLSQRAIEENWPGSWCLTRAASARRHAQVHAAGQWPAETAPCLESCLSKAASRGRFHRLKRGTGEEVVHSGASSDWCFGDESSIQAGACAGGTRKRCCKSERTGFCAAAACCRKGEPPASK